MEFLSVLIRIIRGFLLNEDYGLRNKAARLLILSVC